jgi:hypothetical protein
MNRPVIWAILLCAGLATQAKADVITDWNARCANLLGQAKIGTPPSVRVMAYVQTAAFEAANAVSQRYPGAMQSRDAKGASIEAAVAAAHRAALLKMLPAQQTAIESAYQVALSSVPDGAGKAAGIAVGEQAAARLFAQRAEDAIAPESYRPQTAPGTYVPTATPAVTQWPQRKPWLMKTVSDFRPAGPPALNSATWVRDYNEVKAIGARNSTQRTAEQTAIGKFWDYSLPAIYFGAMRSVAEQPGRDVTRNALLYAMAAQAMDDALIAVFDAKYQYNFWRPVTAIRNGDIDGNDATERDPSWAPLIDTPMHPEYPSAHGILAASVGAVLKVDLGNGPVPVLTTVSPTANGSARSWNSIDDFVQEVGLARVYAGIHYRTSVEVGADMGRRIGELAATRFKVLTQ